MSTIMDLLIPVRQSVKQAFYDAAFDKLLEILEIAQKIDTDEYDLQELWKLLGLVYSRPECKAFSHDKAVEFYEKAAHTGSAITQHALAGELTLLGRTEEALHWYKMAGLGGRAECAGMAYSILRQRNDPEWQKFLILAAKGLQPFAVRDLAFLYMGGGFGWRNFFWGLYLYFSNLPRLARRLIKMAKRELFDGK